MTALEGDTEDRVKRLLESLGGVVECRVTLDQGRVRTIEVLADASRPKERYEREIRAALATYLGFTADAEGLEVQIRQSEGSHGSEEAGVPQKPPPPLAPELEEPAPSAEPEVHEPEVHEPEGNEPTRREADAGAPEYRSLEPRIVEYRIRGSASAPPDVEVEVTLDGEATFRGRMASETLDDVTDDTFLEAAVRGAEAAIRSTVRDHPTRPLILEPVSRDSVEIQGREFVAVRLLAWSRSGRSEATGFARVEVKEPLGAANAAMDALRRLLRDL